MVSDCPNLTNGIGGRLSRGCGFIGGGLSRYGSGLSGLSRSSSVFGGRLRKLSKLKGLSGLVGLLANRATRTRREAGGQNKDSEGLGD